MTDEVKSRASSVASGSPLRQKPYNACVGVLEDVATPAQWLLQNFLRCPITGQRQRIIDVRGGKSLTIITVGPRSEGEQRTGWKHRINVSEIDPKAALKKVARRDGKANVKDEPRHGLARLVRQHEARQSGTLALASC